MTPMEEIMLLKIFLRILSLSEKDSLFLVEELGYTIDQACAVLDAHRGTDGSPLQRVRDFGSFTLLEDREWELRRRWS